MDIKVFSTEIIQESFDKKVQDVYILPKGSSYNLYYRYSKKRTFQRELSYELGQQLISRFKYLGEMDIGEKRKAQLGSMTYPLGNQQVRLRLSSVGDYLQRESLVIRLLYDLSANYFRCFCPQDLKIIDVHTKERGLYLFSGPVGSGKTSLMYYLARKTSLQVITIEDPVEIEEPLFLQLQVNDKIEQTYEQLLKLSLRHRPDLLIIGEIRDKQTAIAAVRAALTGHRVYATVHARCLEGVETRMSELMGKNKDFLECLSGVVYQEILLDPFQSTAVLWAYNFSYRGAAEKRWGESHEEAKKTGWQTTTF